MTPKGPTRVSAMKRKRGRRVFAANMARERRKTARINLKIEPERKARWERLAMGAGISLAAWLTLAADARADEQEHRPAKKRRR
jgi:hypothetical protein